MSPANPDRPIPSTAPRARELQKLRNQRRHLENLGRSARPDRRRALIEILIRERLTREPDLEDEIAEADAQMEAAKLEARYEKLAEIAGAFAPLHDPWPTRTNDCVWVNAVLGLPVFAYLRRRLEAYAGTGRPGKGGKRLVAGVFLWMALGRKAPNIASTLEDIQGSPKMTWAMHDLEEGPGYKSVAKTLKSSLDRVPTMLPKYTLIELARQVAELKDANGKLRFPGGTDVLAVDGTLVEAKLPQAPELDKESFRVNVRNRRGLARTAFVVYKSTRSVDRYADGFDPDGKAWEGEDDFVRPVTEKIRKQCNGWKFVVLYFPRLGVAAHAGLFPATVDERKAVLTLLHELLTIWPELRVRYLVADGYFDTQLFCERLLFNYGILPVTARGSAPGRDWAYVAGNSEFPGKWGVPCCEHGLMIYRGREAYVLVDDRAELGLKPGQPTPNREARNRFKCSAGICKEVSTFPKHNARLYTYHSRVEFDDLVNRNGEVFKDKTATERYVLQAVRNGVESFYSLFKGAGLGNGGQWRAGWTTDTSMEHLLVTGAAGINAKRLVWATGDYERAEAEFSRLGFDRVHSTNDAAWPTPDDVRESLAKMTTIPLPPRGWIGEWEAEDVAA